MATHSSVLAWRIPGTGEPGGLWGRTESDTTEATQQQQQGQIQFKTFMDYECRSKLGAMCRDPRQALLTKWRHSPNPLSSSHRHGPGMKELGFVILTCSFFSLVELAGKNIKVLIVLERSMRKHKAFYSCAQKIIYKITIDICSRIFTKNVPG